MILETRISTLILILLVTIFGSGIAQQITKSECLECHADKDLTKLVNDTVEVTPEGCQRNLLRKNMHWNMSS